MEDARTDQPATGSEIREIMGPLDDAVITTILGVGTTRNEVIEAYTWLSADDRMRQERHSMIHGKTVRVWRILEAELPPSGDER